MKLLFLTLFAICLSPFVALGQADVFDNDPNLERCREATVRVHNRNSVGSGTFFHSEGDEYFILTNNHVAGNKGNRVTFQMWWKGYLSKEIPGTVVFSVNKRNFYRDIAVISVKKSDLGGYEPSIVPIAPPDYQPQYQRIYSFGCGAGSWLTNWEGHSINVDSRSGDVVHFIPQPAGGRSGSAIFSHDGKYIIALIAWRSEGGQHSLDGNSENPRQYGIAMTFREVQLAFKGGNTAVTDYPVNPIPLELPEYEKLINLDVPDDAPIVFQSNVDLDNPEIHGAEKVLEGRQLKFFDRRAEDNDPTSSGVLTTTEGGTFTQVVPLISTQDIFPGAPRNQQQGNPGLPLPEGQEPGDDSNPLFKNAPKFGPKKEAPAPENEPVPEKEPELEQPPKLIPKLIPKPEPEQEFTPELTPEPSPGKEPENPPLEQSDPNGTFNLLTWVENNPWLALLGALAIIGWFKSLFNWIIVRTVVATNKDAVRKLVCPSE